MPLAFDAAILSRIRSPVTSRSNCAKDRQHVQRQATHRRGGVERLGHRHERDVLGVEDVDDPSTLYFSRCAEARAAGVAPIHIGEPGYRERLDADDDGIACEPYRGR